LEDDGVALGILPPPQYKKYVKISSLSYQAGDFIVLVTDGVLEARPVDKLLQFGTVRLKETVSEYLNNDKSPSAKGMKNHIRKRLYHFIKEGEQTVQQPAFDDITVVVLHLK
jgi:serine phosphatase RsbU (regulator of sigma subunit)